MSSQDAPSPNRNAVRHGLTAEQPLDLDESRRLAELTAMWARRLGVADMAERLVAHRIAVSILKLERCEEADRAAVGPNVAAARDGWNRRRRHAIRKRAQGLEADPAGTVAALEGSAFGCDWLIRKWAELKATADVGRLLSEDEALLALRLLGRRPESASVDDQDARVVVAAATASAQHGAASVFVALADRAVARLEMLRDAAWQKVEGPEEAAVIANARVDTSDEGRLRHRYEQDAERALGRNVDFLRKLRKLEPQPATNPAFAPTYDAARQPTAAPAAPAAPAVPAAPAAPAAAPAAGAPSVAHPSRNEAPKADGEAKLSEPISIVDKGLGEMNRGERIDPLRRTEAAPTGALRRTEGAPKPVPGAPDRRRPAFEQAKRDRRRQHA